MKRIMMLFFIAMTLSLTACGKKSDENVGMPNPFIDCATLDAAAKLAGFEFSVPDEINGYTERKITAVENELIQVLYDNPGEDSDSNNLLIRKAAGSEDISGDYNDYSEVGTAAVNNLQVTLKGDNGKVNVAVWADDGYSLAIVTNNAVSEDEIIEIIQNIK